MKKQVVKRVISTVMAVMLLLSVIPLDGIFGTNVSANSNIENDFVDAHIDFINSYEYSSLINDNRWAQVLDEGYNSPLKNVAAFCYDILHVTNSFLSFKFNDIKINTNAYYLAVTSLFYNEETQNWLLRIFENENVNAVKSICKNLKIIFQSSEKWDKSLDYDFDVEIESLLNSDSFSVGDLTNNKLYQKIYEILINNNVTLQKVEKLFSYAKSATEIAESVGSIVTLITTIKKFITYEAAIVAFQNTSYEFKIILRQLKGSGNDYLEKAVNEYLQCIDDEKAQEIFAQKIVVEGVTASASISSIFKTCLNNVTVEVVSALFNISADAAGTVCAVIFAYKFGFFLGNLVTGIDKIAAGKKALNAYGTIENRLFNVLNNYSNALLLDGKYEDALLFETAFKMFKNVQLSSIETYLSMLDAEQESLSTFIVSLFKWSRYDDIEAEIKAAVELEDIWKYAYCHQDLSTSGLISVSEISGGNNSKVLYLVACPTDVSMFDDDGNLLAQIINNEIVYEDDICTVVTLRGRKAIMVPSGIDVKLDVVGTDTGTMDICVYEYSSNENVRSIEYNDIPIDSNSEYTLESPEKIMQPTESYVLKNVDTEEIIVADSDSLPPTEDSLIDVVVAEELFDGFSAELLDTVANAMFSLKSSVDIDSYGISVDDAVALFSALAKIYPSEYNLLVNDDFTYRIICSPERNVISKIRFYYGEDVNLSDYNRRVKELNAEIDSLVEKTKDMSDFETALFVHDYIVLHSEYDLELLDIMKSTNGILDGEIRSERYTEYSILVNGTGICGSYALAYRAVLNAAGMECLYLSSAEMDHAWNLVKIDGNWYHVDCCWDDPVPDTFGKAKRTYFLRTDDEIMKLNHYSWAPGHYKATNSRFSDMPRGYDTTQKYDSGNWYFLSGGDLNKSDINGKNKVKLCTLSATSIDIEDEEIYYSVGKSIYRYDLEAEKGVLAYTLSPKECGSEPSKAIIKNIYVNGYSAEIYKSIVVNSEQNTVRANIKFSDVLDAITGVEIGKAELSLDIFNNETITAQIVSSKSTSGLNVVWSSSNNTVASVDSAGKITANNVGTVTITAAFGEFSASCVVTVTGNGLEGNCGTGIKWSFNPENGMLTISGSGSMNNYHPNHNPVPWYQFRENIKSVDIKDGITNIGEYAFYNCDGLINIEIPNSVTIIGDSAFANCESLTNIAVPKGVTVIGYRAFYDCYGLTSITIPTGVTSIGDEAFHWCSSLTSIKIPSSVTSIGDEAFYNCRLLTSITIPKGVTSIGNTAFSSCDGLKTITVANDNKFYSNDSYGVLYNKSKTKLIQYPLGNLRTPFTIPNSVSSIEEEAFEYCKNLTNITIPNSVTSIGASAFGSCSGLTSITIPNSVVSIGRDAFSFCNGLTSIVIPDSVTSIGEYAFRCCDNLKNVTIGNCLAEISGSVFRKCGRLARITVSGNNMSYSSDSNGVLYNKDKNEIILYPIGNQRTSFSIPESVTRIGSDVFYGCTGLTSITIPDGVTSIGYNAFYGCTGLTSITIPDSVTSVGSSAFSHCTSLTNIIIPNSVKSLGSGAFEYCENLMNVTIGNGVTIIRDSAFEHCSRIIKIRIPNSVTRIEDRAFSSCSGLTRVVIPNSVKTIEFLAFAKCSSLSSVIIPESVESHGTIIWISKTRDIFSASNSLDRILAKGPEAEKIIRKEEGISPDCKVYCCRGADAPESEVIYDIDGYKTTLINIDVLEHTEHIYFTKDFCDATDTADGYIDYVCYCGYEYREVLHNMVGSETVEPTCTKDGTKGLACTNCDHKDVETVSATGHNYVITNKIEGDCSTKVIITYSCTKCGDTYTEIGDPDIDKHDYETQVVAPTCTKPGYTVDICNNCHEKVIYNYTSPTGHKMKITRTAATCQNQAVVEYVCETCGYREIVADKSSNLAAHKPVIDPAVSATCTTNGKTEGSHCSVCNAIIVAQDVIPMLEHSFGEWTETTPATCTEGGIETHVCTHCTHSETQAITAKGHTEVTDKAVVPTCTKTGLTEGKHCSVCNAIIITQETIPAYGHSYEEWTVSQEATIYVSGKMQRICSVCGNIEEKDYTIEPIPFAIRRPSMTTINYGDSIVLHADVELPDGARVIWNADNGNFTYFASTDGKTCTITPQKNGDTTFTAKVVDANGKAISEEYTQKMTSKAGFFQKLIAFFKKLFGATKVIAQAYIPKS